MSKSVAVWEIFKVFGSVYVLVLVGYRLMEDPAVQRSK